MKFKVVSKRVQYQTDDGLEAESPERAAEMVAARESNAPIVDHHHNWFFESDVFDEHGKHLAKFHLDEQGHIVQPAAATKPAPANAMAPATPPAAPPVEALPSLPRSEAKTIDNVGKK